MSQQRSHKSPEEYSTNPKSIYQREYKHRPENAERRRKDLERQYARRRERLANDPEYRARHAAKNNARLKERRKTPESWVRVALNQCFQRAKKKGLPFDIEPEDIFAPIHCPVFGVELKYGASAADPYSPSFDKLKPELGYVKGNVRVISYKANTMKSNGTKAEVAAVLAYMEREGL